MDRLTAEAVIVIPERTRGTMIKLTYIAQEKREKLYSEEEIREFARRHDWPAQQNIMDRLITIGGTLSDGQRLALERMLEIDQSRLELGSPGEYFEVEQV